jgi:hypothetical protein
LANGAATVSLAPSLPVGQDQLTVNYGGDATYVPSSTPVTQEVDRASSTTTASSNGPVHAGTAATLTVQVTGPGPAVPTGTVTVTDSGNNTVGSATLPADGSAFTVSLDPGLPVGNDHLTVTYSSDGNYLASSTTVTQEVDP